MQPTSDRSPARKRPRAALACERCRSKKYKCDESVPCSHCKKSSVECIYPSTTRFRDNSLSADYVQSLEIKIRELTAQLAASDAEIIQQSSNIDGQNDEGLISAVQTKNFTVPSHQEIRTSNQSSNLSIKPDESGNTVEEELTDVNQHTNTVEFHGSTSSIAFLDSLQRRQTHHPGNNDQSFSIVSALHNSAFSPRTGQIGSDKIGNIYFKQAHIFIEAYFENLHFVHPLIDKEHFMTRAADLWFSSSSTGYDKSFIALYLSLMSLGALVRVWDEERLDGLTRFEWSRKLFREAQDFLHDLQFSNDLDTVQCLYFMAKICQNELNPHMAYMYLGLAIRTCFSAGFNRESPNPKTSHSETITKTWWGIYSLEIEMSFSLGRPDSLGMDEYHNRKLPSIQDDEFAIIPVMVNFAKIIRKVSVSIYHRKLKWQEKLNLASQIETELDQWGVSLPEQIRPFTLGRRPIGALKEPKWCRRQRLALHLRYHNVRMLLFRPFLSYFAQSNVSHELLEHAINKCVDSARATIEIIHETYLVHYFFRTWWYNTTYVTFAASVLLYFSRFQAQLRSKSVFNEIEMAIEILDAMDESIVARKLAEFVKRCLQEARNSQVEPNLAPAANIMAPPNPQMFIQDLSDFNLFNAFEVSDFSMIDMTDLFDESLSPHQGTM